METRSNRKVYRKPCVLSEKIFEQAALACSGADISATATVINLKNTGYTGATSPCGYAHS